MQIVWFEETRISIIRLVYYIGNINDWHPHHLEGLRYAYKFPCEIHTAHMRIFTITYVLFDYVTSFTRSSRFPIQATQVCIRICAF
jgi:hypothetical protein